MAWRSRWGKPNLYLNQMWGTLRLAGARAAPLRSQIRQMSGHSKEHALGAPAPSPPPPPRR